jgi:hypothetical protein
MTRVLGPVICGVCLLACCLGCGKGGGATVVEGPPRVGVDVWYRNSTAVERLTGLLQPREAEAAVSVPALSDEAKQIADKLKQAAQFDPRTFLLLVRDASKDGLPNYDARLGITRDEYDALMLHRHLQLKETSKAKLRIVGAAEGKFVLLGLPNLAEATFDVGLQLVSTPYGEVSRPEEFATAPLPELTGPLVGYRWTEPVMMSDLRRYRIHEITLAQSPVDGAVWFIVHIADSIDNRMLVDYYARFAGPQSE